MQVMGGVAGRVMGPKVIGHCVAQVIGHPRPPPLEELLDVPPVATPPSGIGTGMPLDELAGTPAPELPAGKAPPKPLDELPAGKAPPKPLDELAGTPPAPELPAGKAPPKPLDELAGALPPAPAVVVLEEVAPPPATHPCVWR
jgi:hypothetical protein